MNNQLQIISNIEQTYQNIFATLEVSPNLYIDQDKVVISINIDSN